VQAPQIANHGGRIDKYMATRSLIAYRSEKNKKIYSIYCHWGGSPDENGKILAKYYHFYYLASELIDNGNIGALENTYEECRRLGAPEKEHRCVERGGYIHDSISSYVRDRPIAFLDYLYLFVDSQWRVYDIDKDEWSDIMYDFGVKK